MGRWVQGFLEKKVTKKLEYIPLATHSWGCLFLVLVVVVLAAVDQRAMVTFGHFEPVLHLALAYPMIDIEKLLGGTWVYDIHENPNVPWQREL
jgi:hypothetical protein